MSAEHAHEELHHLVDRLSPDQARRLLRLVKTDPELAEAADEPVRRRRLSIAGIGASGEGDLSERVEDLLAERLEGPRLLPSTILIEAGWTINRHMDPPYTPSFLIS
ncbi:hypothetical protein AB0J42_25280 [Nonomuraea sp. NPDC049649]|uniref:hypothetical protein n=1 Tax=Nonomuraea sp. NPDC049649 TaxID=3155776 RepID=UPI003445D78F